MDPSFLSEGFRIWRASSRRKRQGWKHYPFAGKGGDSAIKAICEGIIEDCWEENNGQGHYCASAGHFHQFYTRDFGIACEGLLGTKQGKERCIATLGYALDTFSKVNHVAVAVTPRGVVFDFPTFSPDSLAYLLRALRVCEEAQASKTKALVASHKTFLEGQIKEWCEIVIAEDGFVRKGVHFGGMRDHAIRSSSCYDNALILVVKEEAKALGLRTPPIALTPALFVKEFWHGTHLMDDRATDANGKRIDRLSGDANVVPFWLGVVKDNKRGTLARTALRTLHDAGMDTPLPLAYSPSTKTAPPMIWQNIFAKDWESNTRWLQLGLMYTAVAKQADKKLFAQAREALRANILANKNILEVFTHEGKPYTSAFYHADEGMLWGAALAKQIL